MNNKIKNLETKRELVRQQQSQVFMDSAEAATGLFAKYLQEYQMNTDVSFKVRPQHGWNKYFVPFNVEFGNNAWNAVKFEHKTYSTEDKEVSIKFQIHSEYGVNNYRSNGGDTLMKLAFFGKVAEMVNNEQNRIITEMTELLMNNEEVYMALQDEIRNIDIQIGNLKREAKEKAQEKLIKKLQKTGINTKPDSWRNTTFDYGYNKTFREVTNVKILNISKSGKTANIEVTMKQPYYTGKKGLYIETANKVKMENIIKFAELNEN